MFSDWSLTSWCLLLAGLYLVLGLPFFICREKAVAAMKGFSRHELTGRILSTIAWAWGALAIVQMKLDFLQQYNVIILVLALVCIPLSWFWMKNLLPCRAVGGILCLLPYGLLHVTRIHNSPWRLVVVVLAYIMIVQGMTLLLYPWKLRQYLDWISSSAKRITAFGAVHCALALVLLILGFTVLR